MGMFFVYILKSSLCLALFYLFYRLLLSKETFHRFNRLALLGVLALSGTIPFVKITIQNPTEAGILFDELMQIPEAMSPEASVSLPMEEVSAPFPWMALVLLMSQSMACFTTISVLPRSRIMSRRREFMRSLYIAK